MKTNTNKSQPSKNSSFLSTFNWEDTNIKQLLQPIQFYINHSKNDTIQPFNHHTHKNLPTLTAPYLPQTFTLHLASLTNIKHITISNYTNASEMTISISHKQSHQPVTVYQDKYICKGKTLKNNLKEIDLGALPCKMIKIQVGKGCKISSKSIELIGVQSERIKNELGQEYEKLLVINPMRIIYGQF